jgi:outer membrane receptor for ferrienterochelin and colicins
MSILTIRLRRHSRMSKYLFLSLIVVFGVSVDSHARGTIQGTVVSRDNREPLPGTNILLQGTVLGTTTDMNGMFVLKNIPTGVYSLSISLVGYERKIVGDVRVEENRVTEITVELSSSPIQTEPVVVTASKREQSLQEVPASVSILEAKELSYRNTITIDDALRYVPGVNMTQGQVNIRGSTGYSRGVGTRVLLLVDGLPLLTGDTGEIVWESLPVYQIDRVEVVKGAGSALYGSSALGGVINILTKEVRDRPETRLRMYGGIYATPKYPQWRWTEDSRFFNGVYASHAQRFDNLSLFVGGSRTADEGFKRNESWRRYNASVRAAYNFSPFESFDVLFSLLDQRRGNFFYWKDLENALAPAAGQDTQRVYSHRWSLGSSYKKFISDKFYYNTKVSLYRTRWEDNVDAGHRSTADFFNGEVQATYRAFDDHILTFGVYGMYTSVSAETIFGIRDGYGFATYLQDEITVAPQLRLTVGGRLDVQQVDTVNTFAQFNPKIGIVHNVDEYTVFRASVGRGFRAPSVAEMFTTTQAGGLTISPNPDLRPERSWSFEVGASHTFNENIFAQVSLFQNEFWDLIEPKLDGVVRFQNVTRARVQGFEVGLNTNFFAKTLFVDVGYTYMYPRDVSLQDMLKYRPRHILYLSSRLQFEHVQVGIDQRYLSKVEKIDDELVRFGIIVQGDKRVPIYVTDIRFNVDWAFVDLPLISSFHVNNLLGYHYVELIGNIASIRNFVFTLEAKL